MSDQKIWGVGLEHRITQQGEIRINCPFCPQVGKGEDTKFHCYVNTTKGVFNCYRCKSTGPLSKLKGFLNNFASPTINIKPDELRAKLKGLFKPKKTTKFDLDEISWSIDDPACPLGYGYMHERGFTDEEMQKYSLRVGKNYKDEKGELVRRWAGRILFPFYEEGEVVFVVGRSYNDKDPKYINSLGSKDHVVYGIDRVVDGSCILCEGIISAIASERVTGVPSISCLGKTATRYQLSKIRNKTNKIYVALDGTDDVTERDRKNLNRSLLKLGLEVFEVLPPKGQDPDDAKEDFLRCFKEAKRIHL